MIVFSRQDHIYKLCMLCTLLMLITTIFNIAYIVRRSSKNNNHKKNYEYVQSTTMSIKQTYQANKSRNKYDSFEKAYQTLLHSFINNYIITSNNENHSLLCPPVPPDLKGPIFIEDPPENFSLLTKSLYHSEVQYGGYYQPRTCLPRHKIAIIVPYRDRQDILRHFLFHTHLFLQRQQLNYRIYVCEQAFNKTFNKGIVMNSCFKEILKLQPNTPCFIMHDVDLLLIDDRNMYTCPIYPRHLSVAIDKFHFYLPYKALVGGVLAMRREHYLLVNGYSTNYWGWGGEDDDMYERIKKKNLILERPPAAIARYRMLKHTHQKLNPSRLRVLRTAHFRIDSDGVNNVNYTLLKITLYPLFTHFLIDVGEEKF